MSKPERGIRTISSNVTQHCEHLPVFKFWLLLVPCLSLAIASQLLPIATLVSKAEVSQTSSLSDRQAVSETTSSAKPVYFPRRGEARYCFITSPDTCIFRDELSVEPLPIVPVLDLSLEYRKAEFIAEIAAKYAASKNYDSATIIAKLAITKPLPKALALTTIAAEYAKAGQTELAQQRLAEALQTIQTTTDNLFRIRALPQIAAQYAAIGQAETASQIFEQVRQDILITNSKLPLSFQSQPIGEVAVGLLAAGRTAEAEEIIQQLLQAIQTEGKPFPLYPSALQPLLKAEQYDFAIRMVEDVPDPTFRNRWLSDICSSLATSGEYHRAIQLAQTLPEKGLASQLSQQASFLNGLNDVVQLAEAGKFVDALAMAELIQSPYYKALVLTQISSKFAEAGQTTQAQQTLSQAVQIAKTVEGVLGEPGDGGGLIPIAVTLAHAGQFSEALELTEQIKDESYKVLAMTNIAERYIKTEQYERALETLSATSRLVSSLQCSGCAR